MKWIRNAIGGAILSLTISYVFNTVSFYYQNITVEPTVLLREMIVALILGLVVGAMTIVFQFGNWSLLKSVIVHYSATILVILIIGKFADWYNWSLQSVGKLLLSFSILYLIIWFIQYGGMKRDVEDVNNLIQQKNKR